MNTAESVIVDTSAPPDPTMLLSALECELAAGGEQFGVQYQPKYNLKSGAVVGLEALMRWHHPDFGSISPELFIPAAEELGGMVALWERLLHLVARDVSGLGTRALPVALNVSPSLLSGSDVLRRLVEVFDSYGVSPACIDIEITEGIFIRDRVSTVAAMSEIRAAGYKIALDDFGTGFSCLSYLVDLPLDVLKLDKSFVAAMLREKKCHAVVESVVSLAHQLGLQVVAEGIETSEQHRLLRNVGTDVGQGYYYSRPMTYRVLADWLADKVIEPVAELRDGVRRVACCQSEMFVAPCPSPHG